MTLPYGMLLSCPLCKLEVRKPSPSRLMASHLSHRERQVGMLQHLAPPMGELSQPMAVTERAIQIPILLFSIILSPGRKSYGFSSAGRGIFRGKPENPELSKAWANCRNSINSRNPGRPFLKSVKHYLAVGFHPVHRKSTRFRPYNLPFFIAKNLVFPGYFQEKLKVRFCI